MAGKNSDEGLEMVDKTNRCPKCKSRAVYQAGNYLVCVQCGEATLDTDNPQGLARDVEPDEESVSQVS